MKTRMEHDGNIKWSRNNINNNYSKNNDIDNRTWS